MVQQQAFLGIRPPLSNALEGGVYGSTSEWVVVSFVRSADVCYNVHESALVLLLQSEKMMNDLYVLRIQTALFLSTLDLNRKLNLALAVQAASGNLLSGEPIVLPTPDNLPPDLPVLIIQSEDGVHMCQIARGRVDVVYRRRLEQVADRPLSLESTVEAHIQLMGGIWRAIQSDFRGLAHRIGFVVRQVAFQPDGQGSLSSTFLDDERFDLASELQIHALHKMALNSYQINRWVRLMTAPASEGIAAQSVLQVEVDVNTLPDARLDLSADDVEAFSRSAYELTLETIQQFLE